MAHLTGHFSADYETLTAELSALARTIEAAQEEEIALDHKTDFYAELSERFTSQKSKLDKLLKARKTALGDLVAALSEKQTKAFTSLECPAVACRQLFISTHSFEFYNLIREWVADDEGGKHAEKPQANWKEWSVFYVKRTDSGEAVLEEIRTELLRFKSEYHYLFSTLYHFDKTGSAPPFICARQSSPCSDEGGGSGSSPE